MLSIDDMINTSTYREIVVLAQQSEGLGPELLPPGIVITAVVLALWRFVARRRR